MSQTRWFTITRTALILGIFAALIFVVGGLPGSVAAAPTQGTCTVDDTFDSVDPAWVTDRYEPAEFTSELFDGDNRLKLRIDDAQASTNRPSGQEGIFYNTQGRNQAVAATGKWSASADLFVSSDMLSGNNLRRTDIWARTGEATENLNTRYYILGIIRNDPADPWNPNAANLNSAWRIWDADSPNGWVNVGTPSIEGWYHLEIWGDDTKVEYFIDGNLVYTDQTVVSAFPNLTNIYLQAYNFSLEGAGNLGQDYTVYWDNALAGSECSGNVTIATVAPTGTTTSVAANVCATLAMNNWTKGWFACDENSADDTGFAELAAGPGIPPLGSGSAHFIVGQNTDGPAIFNSFEPGLRLSDILSITYDAYGIATDRPNFFINVDYDLTDTSNAWQGRLVWSPNLPGCSAAVANTWQTFDPFALPNANCWYQTGNPVVGGVTGIPPFPLNGSAGPISQILSQYPNIGVHPTLGAIGFKVGSGHTATEAAVDKLTIGYLSANGYAYKTWDFEPGATMTVAATNADICTSSSVEIDLINVPGAYGYEFIVNYDDTLVNQPLGAFSDELFDPADGGSPPDWEANCTDGSCKFALTLWDPSPDVTGSGTVATIDFTAKKAGTFPLVIQGVKLTDRDGMEIATELPPTNLSFDVCGTATISGRVSMQGRLAPFDEGIVSLTPKAGGLPVSTNFSAIDGSFSLSVPYLPGGQTFVLNASHDLYLSNQKDLLVNSTVLTGQNTRLWGGDARNDGVVGIEDLSCIGGDFGKVSPDYGNCEGDGSPDINLDYKVNIQDLSIAGGNFDKPSPQNW